MKLYLRKLPGGMLVADDDESAAKLQKLPAGVGLGVSLKEERNYKFLQKTMTLFTYCFEHFSEAMEDCHLEWRGMKAAPCKEEFRKNLTILAGHYTVTITIAGKVKPVAKSLSYENCTEEEAQQIYNDVINAALKYVYQLRVSEQELKKIVDTILGYA